jgi:aspartyl protease family protein
MRSYGTVPILALFCTFFFAASPEEAWAQEAVVTRKSVSIVPTQRGLGKMFIVKGKINAVDVDFVIDTGATSLAISFDTAMALGLKEKEPIGWIVAMTASGPTPVPIFMLDEISIGDIVVRDVRANVLPQGAQVNLLGNAFLLMLNRFEYRDGVLTLEQ